MLLSAHATLGVAPYTLLLILVILTSTTTTATAQTLSNASTFPLAHITNHQARDPSIIMHNNEYYLFQTSGGIQYFRASDLSGPWKHVGAVLDRGPSVIDKGNPFEPWAPTVIQYNGTFYCFYCVSTINTRNSSIGVATSDSLQRGSWTDHGALINTVSGQYANVYPYNVSNALDPSVIVDPVVGNQAYLAFGSYWTDIWQVRLSEDLLSVENAQQPNASHLSLNTNFTAEEGSWISYRAPYYYLWYSRGYCCGLELDNLPTNGTEYSIHVGRSLDISGPYVNKDNVPLLDGGGTMVYGSNNRGQVYAPGSCGVLSIDSDQDVLFYHYLNISIGVSDGDALLGYNYLSYEDGWPVVVSSDIDKSNVQNIMSSGSYGLHSLNSSHFPIFCIVLWAVWQL